MRIYNSFNELPGGESLNNQSFNSPSSIFNDYDMGNVVFNDFNMGNVLRSLVQKGDAVKNRIKQGVKQGVAALRKLGETAKDPNAEYPYDINDGWTFIRGSSYLQAIAYDYDTNQMLVMFWDGAIYAYDCSPTEIDDILDAESRGQYFYYNDRTTFPYHRIKGPS